MTNAAEALRVTESQREVLEALAVSQVAAHREVQRARVLLLAADGTVMADTVHRAGVDQVRESRCGSWAQTDDLEGRHRSDCRSDPELHPRRRNPLEHSDHGQTGRGFQGHCAAGLVGAWAQAAPGQDVQVVERSTLEEKLIDVVGLYLDPPEKAIVLCMDEKSSVQALDRTQSSLPMVRGRAATMTHDYKRHGTTTLFAALDVLTGKVIGSCLPKHRHSEFVRFLKTIDAEVPTGLQVHLVLDNYATHQHPNVVAWLDEHPRFHLHFTPTASSWLNLVERWFRELTEKALRRGVFHSVPDLITAIEAYLDAHNDDPKPFVWTAPADDILAKVSRGRVALQAATQD